jgi:hypothetical protein
VTNAIVRTALAGVLVVADGSLSVHGPGVKRGIWFERGNCWAVGGACGRLAVRVCARAPSLISVRGPGWFRVGDMMVDGVIPLGEALRPLCL